MGMLKKSIAIALSSILVLGLTACSTTVEDKSKEEVVKDSSNSHYPVTITTYNYEKKPVEITFEKEPESVVAVYQNSIETMLALGLEDKITLAAGLDHDVKDEYKDAFNKVKYSKEFTPDKETVIMSKPDFILEDKITLAAGLDHDVKDEYKDAFNKVKYSKEFTPDKETVIMSKPDFILSWYSLFGEKNLGDIDYWNENGTNTYMSLNSGAAEDRTVDNEITDILNLGKIFNVEDKAKALVDEINNGIDSVVSKVKDQEKQTALIIEYMDGQIYTYGAKTLGGDMVSKLGAELLNPDGGNISEEDLIKLNPDSIFVVYMDRSDEEVAQNEIDKVLENKALASLNAVKNNRVNSIALGEMYCSGIRTIDGINTFANGLYPQLNK